MKQSTQVVHIGLADALSKGPPPPGNLAVPIFAHGSLVVELYSPSGSDPQREQRHSVEAGSFLFVPAGHVHRFEDFSSDFVVWVVFYGPEGGETSNQAT